MCYSNATALIFLDQATAARSRSGILQDRFPQVGWTKVYRAILSPVFYNLHRVALDALPGTYHCNIEQIHSYHISSTWCHQLLRCHSWRTNIFLCLDIFFFCCAAHHFIAIECCTLDNSRSPSSATTWCSSMLLYDDVFDDYCAVGDAWPEFFSTGPVFLFAFLRAQRMKMK